MNRWQTVPEKLKRVKRWVCWKLMNNVNKVKPDKIPVNPFTGENAKSNKSDTWGTFLDAYSGYKKYGLSGIGIMLGDGIVGIDLDHCVDRETKEINKFALNVLSQIDSYTEYSPSGEGIHILAYGKLPEGRRRNNFIEMYDGGRFFTVTGEVVNERNEMKDQTKEISKLHAEIFIEEEKNIKIFKVQTEKTTDFDDDELIEKAHRAKKGEDFKMLWEGKWETTYSSQSEADLALCSLLAFWTNGDIARVDNLFRKSELYRPKWDSMRGSNTYGEITIEKALSSMGNGYISTKYEVHDEKNLWENKLGKKKNGELKNTLTNMILILRNDPKLKGIYYNEFKDTIEVDGDTPWKRLKRGWSKTDEASLAGYMDSKYKMYASLKLREAVLKVAVEKSRHPVREYLKNLPKWDEKKRVEEILIKYLGAEDSVYTREVTRKTLVAAVARVMNPGIKFDTVLILNGPQGIGKSTLLAKLGGSFFSDSLSIADMRDKTAAEKLQGYWIVEIAELSGIRKTDEETLKAFISRVDDKYRASYGYTVEDHPRECIIVGTTNQESGFLRDISGGRRYWPVMTAGVNGEKPWDIKDVEQIWAEVMVLYKAGEKLTLSERAQKYANIAQNNALESDEREGLIKEYLDILLPMNWDSMNISQRRLYIRDEAVQVERGCEQRKMVCAMEIWSECFGKDKSDISKQASRDINAIMKKIHGWKKYNGNKNGMKVMPGYGKQRVFVRCEGTEEQLTNIVP